MADFEVKRKALFASLDIAGNELKGTILDQSKTESHTINLLKRSAPCEEISSDRTLTKLRGKESIFKKPELPISKCLKPRVVPDYQVNPHKWKKYSLADVDISDNSNTLAHEMFIRSLMDKQNDGEDVEDGGGDDKIVFNKVVKIKRSIRNCDEVEDYEVDKPKLKGSKLVMPEYVIGKKAEKAKAKKKPVARPEAGRQLTLSHLQEDDDEDEELGLKMDLKK